MKLLEGFSHLQPNYNPDEDFFLPPLLLAFVVDFFLRHKIFPLVSENIIFIIPQRRWMFQSDSRKDFVFKYRCKDSTSSPCKKDSSCNDEKSFSLKGGTKAFMSCDINFALRFVEI